MDNLRSTQGHTRIHTNMHTRIHTNMHTHTTHTLARTNAYTQTTHLTFTIVIVNCYTIVIDVTPANHV